MSEHTATIHWQRGDDDFTKGRYSRAHEWRFDGGVVVPASASPHVVRAPWSDPTAVDPEEAFVAAVASCHMLWFLSLAAERGIVVESYDDEAVGIMGRIAPERHAVTEIVLRPRIVFGGASAPDAAAIQTVHDAAHERCFIANSITSAIRIEPRS